MWKVLPDEDKQEYKRLILSFASLTNMFAQKSEDEETILSPIVNSKFQETAFQKTLHAYAEDIGNTSYDASIRLKKDNGTEIKFLVGIKTFGISSGDQKIAQFKTNHNTWSSLVDEMERNAHDEKGLRTQKEINALNHHLYLELARQIAMIRNERISSSEENLRGFKIKEKDDIHSVYHVLMPSKKGDNPKIYVGETSYNKIDIENIEILGCTNQKNPTNFMFQDRKHVYKYTSADSQLYMKFNNNDIVLEEWDVIYAEDAYEIFLDIADKIYGKSLVSKKSPKIIESYSWSLLNRDGEVEMFSGFNSFYGVGSKLNRESRLNRIEKFCNQFENEIDYISIAKFRMDLIDYLTIPTSNMDEKIRKVHLREQITDTVSQTGNNDLIKEIEKLLYRPLNEMYIPIPNSKKFHNEHPDFFGKNIAQFVIDENTGKETSKLALPPEERKFNLVFEPSGDSIISFITQDNGKGIESLEKQSYLGEWILRKVFQLREYEPLTKHKLEEIGINGIRLYKVENSEDIHLQFIWIDEDNLPEDYIK